MSSCKIRRYLIQDREALSYVYPPKSWIFGQKVKGLIFHDFCSYHQQIRLFLIRFYIPNTGGKITGKRKIFPAYITSLYKGQTLFEI